MRNFRNVGKPWAYELTMRDLLGNEVSKEAAVKAALALASRIRIFLQENVIDPNISQKGWKLADRFEALAASQLCDCDYFNHDLDKFWDWADDARILVK